MILLVNGPNLNLLGEREPEVYGTATLADVVTLVSNICSAASVQVQAFQSNGEGPILDFLQQHRRMAKGLILNPGAFTHYSYALHDCLKALAFPKVEVHISNIHAREEWRHKSVLSGAVDGQIVGLGILGYQLAAEYLLSRIAPK